MLLFFFVFSVMSGEEVLEKAKLHDTALLYVCKVEWVRLGAMCVRRLLLSPFAFGGYGIPWLFLLSLSRLNATPILKPDQIEAKSAKVQPSVDKRTQHDIYLYLYIYIDTSHHRSKEKAAAAKAATPNQ